MENQDKLPTDEQPENLPERKGPLTFREWIGMPVSQKLTAGMGFIIITLATVIGVIDNKLENCRGVATTTAISTGKERLDDERRNTQMILRRDSISRAEKDAILQKTIDKLEAKSAEADRLIVELNKTLESQKRTIPRVKAMTKDAAQIIQNAQR